MFIFTRCYHSGSAERLISDENRRDFEERGLHGVRQQFHRANFTAPGKHREAEEWIHEQEHAFDRARIALARSANTRATWALVISVLALVVPLIIQFWSPLVRLMSRVGM
jgi:hypothetical protein